MLVLEKKRKNLNWRKRVSSKISLIENRKGNLLAFPRSFCFSDLEGIKNARLFRGAHYTLGCCVITPYLGVVYHQLYDAGVSNG